MKQIEAFIDSVYQHTGGNKQEIRELKAEMTSHLLEAVHELKAEGKTEQEAIDIAIERFGGEKEMRTIIGLLFKAQKIFAKWILYIAVTCLVLSLSIFGLLVQSSDTDMREQASISGQISDALHNKGAISSDLEIEIERWITETDHIATVKIFNGSEAPNGAEVFHFSKSAVPVYQYNRAVWTPNWLHAELFPYGNGNDQWYVYMETRSFDALTVLVLFMGITIYWTLFSIWAIINAYHQRRLHFGWIIVFALFNILGYLIFHLAGKRTFTR